MSHDDDTHHDDMVLLQQWREGDREAGNRLIRRHYGYAHDIARKRLRNKDDVEEATQHAMTIVVRKREMIETSFRAYLAKVVVFSVLSQARRRAHDPLDGEAGPDVPKGSAPSLIAQRQEEKLMIKALRTMPIDDQLLFYYDFVGDKSRHEIAEKIGVAPDKIYNHVRTAKARLRRTLEGFRAASHRLSTRGGLETWLESIHNKAPASMDDG
ncbi:MAG: sigma-70 family RNA polymerase sigma factor [Myxococcota bacterium]